MPRGRQSIPSCHSLPEDQVLLPGTINPTVLEQKYSGMGYKGTLWEDGILPEHDGSWTQSFKNDRINWYIFPAVHLSDVEL